MLWQQPEFYFLSKVVMFTLLAYSQFLIQFFIIGTDAKRIPKKIKLFFNV